MSVKSVLPIPHVWEVALITLFMEGQNSAYLKGIRCANE